MENLGDSTHHDTEKDIEAARASQFNPHMESVARFGESMRSFTRNITIQVEDPATGEDAQKKRQRLLDDVSAHREQRPFILTLSIDREHIVEQSLQRVCSAPAHRLLSWAMFNVSFDGEEGVDAGGVRRDWFDRLGVKLIEEAESGKGHMMVLEDKTLFPRPNEERYSGLLAIGRLAGMAVYYSNSLPLPLGSVACKFLLGESISPKDVKRLDPDFYQFRVKPVEAPGGVAMLEAALCEPLMFMSAATPLRSSKELCPGGAEKRVTEENKREYLRLLCEYYLIGEREEQIKVFLQGFWDIFPKDQLVNSGVTYRELALLIAGYTTIDPVQWKEHTDTTQANDTDLMDWFWQMVTEMSDEDRAKLLHFVTGSSRLPSSGFSGIAPPFTITIQMGDQDLLPQAHTCGNQLELPRYTSKEMLVDKMLIALANDEGFGFI